MNLTKISNTSSESRSFSLAKRFTAAVCRHAVAGFLGIVILYLSMVITSAPMSAAKKQAIDRAIAVLESRGFDRDATLLRTAATFRSSDNWLNTHLVPSENAYASTNFPVGIITVYHDFFEKAVDDTERAAILLHEAQHLKGDSEKDAYAYVWQNRERLGWTQLSHGMTESYVSIELQTREYVPELFICESKAWRDCTIQLTVNSEQ